MRKKWRRPRAKNTGSHKSNKQRAIERNTRKWQNNVAENAAAIKKAKRMNDLTYDNLIQETLARLPEIKEKYDELLREDIIDEESGNHIVFGYAFTPILVDAIRNNDGEMQRRLFDFLEAMAGSDDVRVVEVCDQSVIETLNDEFEDDALTEMIGEKTREGFESVKAYMY